MNRHPLDSETRPARLRYRFPRWRRLARSRDYRRVFADGKVFIDGELILHAAPNGGNPTRLGTAISRRVGSSARRNRIKRLIREAFRLNCHRFPEGLDLVVTVRKGAELTLDSISASLVGLVAKAAEVCLGDRPRGRSAGGPREKRSAHGSSSSAGWTSQDGGVAP